MVNQRHQRIWASQRFEEKTIQLTEELCLSPGPNPILHAPPAQLSVFVLFRISLCHYQKLRPSWARNLNFGIGLFIRAVNLLNSRLHLMLELRMTGY